MSEIKGVLVVPDVHEKLDKLVRIIATHGPKASAIVFLGDFFDAFGKMDIHRTQGVCEWICANIDGVRVQNDDATDRVVPAEWLLGNHDCHYFFSSPWMRCSGYEPIKQMVIDRILPEDIRRKFKLYTTAGHHTISHAGFHKLTEAFAHPTVEREALEDAFAGKFHPVFGAGLARNGGHAVGGCTWLDWNDEFKPINGMPQIVGHTNGRGVRIKVSGDGEMNYNIDTSLAWVAWVRDGKVLTEATEIPPMES